MSFAEASILTQYNCLSYQKISTGSTMRPGSNLTLNCYSDPGATWYILSPGPGAPRGFGPPLRGEEGALCGGRRCEGLKISAFF
jgi:hypothetical protein